MMKSTVSRRTVVTVVAVLALTAGLVACRPSFPDGATLTTTAEGDRVRISWPAAFTDADKPLASYRIDVDGTEVTRLDPVGTSCVLSGLTPGTHHAVGVTAYDAAGQWSKESKFTASVTGTATGPAGSSGGPPSEIRCDIVDVPPSADVSVVLSQPSPGAGTTLISGQVAPVTYELTVTNAGNAASGEVVVTNPIPAGTTLVADSPACGTATGCTVTTDAEAVEWSVSDLPAATAVTVGFSVAMNPDIGAIDTITSQATHTGPGCDPDDSTGCTTNTVTNPAEPWAWREFPPVGFIPGNVVFFSGINSFRAIPQLTNDPAATITYDFGCVPDYLCLIRHAEGDQVTFELIYDEFEYTDLRQGVTATATQGDRTMERTMWSYFSIIESNMVILSEVAQAAAGRDHTCARLTTGTVRCLGANDVGQVGDGTVGVNRGPDPVPVVGLGDATDIAAGGDQTCAARATGAVSCWGRNDRGQLGDGTTTDRSTPTPAIGLTDAIQLAAGAAHSCALRSGGTVSCWGANGSGQLGDGTTIDRSTPTAVVGLSDATGVDPGHDHTCATRADSSAVCWGANDLGQLGDGSTASSLAPVPVALDSEITSLSAGDGFTCAADTDRLTWCWGPNDKGQLGVNYTQSAQLPVTERTLPYFAEAVVAGDDHACMVQAAGFMACWGPDGNGAGGSIKRRIWAVS